jgi:hypothetical protein
LFVQCRDLPLIPRRDRLAVLDTLAEGELTKGASGLRA